MKVIEPLFCVQWGRRSSETNVKLQMNTGQNVFQRYAELSITGCHFPRSLLCHSYYTFSTNFWLRFCYWPVENGLVFIHPTLLKALRFNTGWLQGSTQCLLSCNTSSFSATRGKPAYSHSLFCLSHFYFVCKNECTENFISKVPFCIDYAEYQHSFEERPRTLER